MPRNYKNIIVWLPHDLNQFSKKVRKRLRATCVCALCHMQMLSCYVSWIIWAAYDKPVEQILRG